MNLTVSPAGEPREVDPGAISCTAIELRWSEPWANVTDSATRLTVTGYRIEAKQRAVDADWQVLVENTGAPSNRIYTHRDLPPRSGWEYRLAAITPNGMGAWSPPLARVAAVRTSRTLEVSSILDLTVQSLYGGSIIHEVEWFRSPDRARPAWNRVTGASDRLYEVTTADIGQIFRVSVIHTELATYYDPVGADDSPVFSESAAEHAVNAGTSLNLLLAEATGGSGAVSYELSPALPSALRFDAEIRTITGTAPGGLSYTGTLTARDPDCDEDSVAVQLTSIGQAPLPPVIFSGGGGGGGAPSGPTPSDVDVEWNVSKDIDALDAGNDEATGLWGDGATIWVAQNSDGAGDSVYAYDLASGERLEDREFELDTANLAPRGIWSDGETMWVLDGRDESVCLYDLGSGEQTAVYELAAAARIYSYNMPDDIDARLASLTLTHIDIGEFSPGRREYTGILTRGAGKTVVEASPVQPGATVEIVPSDVDGDLENGHQAGVDAGTVITVTVTSEDGSRRRVYRVLVEVPPCLDGLGEDFGLVTYEGGGIAQLEGCARRLSVRAVYAWDGNAYVSYILDAPAFVNERFRALFPDDLPADTPLIAQRDVPAASDTGSSEGASGE